VVATGVLYGPLVALLLCPLIPVVGAARLKLRRHTLSQVIAGGVVGGAITLVMVVSAQL
jgi:membrane-associated phospholipid phosphatase